MSTVFVYVSKQVYVYLISYPLIFLLFFLALMKVYKTIKEKQEMRVIHSWLNGT